MPRPRRCLPLGVPIHVTNRGVERRQLFFQAPDYEEYLDLMRDGLIRHAVDVLGYNLMPNHVHLVLAQHEQAAISAYMHRISSVTARNVRRWTSSRGLGHVFQQRFWSRASDGEPGFFSLLRYVEANAKRAGLVTRAEDWTWGSLWERSHPARGILSQPPVRLPERWPELVNTPLDDDALDVLRSPL